MTKKTQYQLRQERLTEEEKQREKEIRRIKDAERRQKADDETKQRYKYNRYRSYSKTFLLEMLKEEDKKEFIEILKSL